MDNNDYSIVITGDLHDFTPEVMRDKCMHALIIISQQRPIFQSKARCSRARRPRSANSGAASLAVGKMQTPDINFIMSILGQHRRR